MNKRLIIIGLSVIVLTGCKPRFEKEVTVEELKSELAFLAGDSLKGRYPGTPEDQSLADYITTAFDHAGLILLAEDGRQAFSIEQGYRVGNGSRLTIGEKDYTYPADSMVFMPLGFCPDDTIATTLRFIAGKDALKAAGGELRGHIVVMPSPSGLPSDAHDAFMEYRAITLEASDYGAEGVIFLLGQDDPAPSGIVNTKRVTAPIPAILLSTVSLEWDNGTMIAGNGADTSLAVQAVTIIEPVESETFNTIAELRGSDPGLRNQFVIMGAHHDHLGIGGHGSSSRRPDTLAWHYGADDNASGVAGVIESAEKIMTESPSRSFVFMTFGGEEMGLLGSKYFTSNPLVDLSQVQAMINMDMIGRLNDRRQLQIGGVGTSPAFRELIDTINQEYHFNIKYSEAGYGPSDHASFYAKDIPVLFISTGAHPDYHTPFDAPDKINYEGLAEVTDFVSEIALALANMPEKIEFTLAGPKEASKPRSGYGKVTLGLMPDVTYEGNDGMPVSFVTEGKPAAAGGMKGGDVIVAVDGKSVGNVYDYMERLGNLKTGQSLIVTVIRDDEKIDLLIQL